MQLQTLEYCENVGKPTEWKLSPTDFANINLVVGKNASGKTRVLAVINSLAMVLSGRQRDPFGSANFKAGFKSDHDYQYDLHMEGGEIQSETLEVDGNQMLNRGQDGSGKIQMDAIGESLDFKVPSSSVVAVARRDEIQHPWLEPLHEWGSAVCLYHFGAEFGRRTAVIVTDKADEAQPDPLNENQVLQLFMAGIRDYGDKFKQTVITDMESLGYDIEDVDALVDPNVQINQPGFSHPHFLFVKENGIPGLVNQINMSQGMYRALALIVHLVYNHMAGLKSLILIDDIGEGLDFERSSSLISLVIEKAKKHFLQTIMTTNDRFVMNAVPLEYWSVVHRDGNHVRLITPKSSPQVFDKFKSVGLSNFDFFSRELFLVED